MERALIVSAGENSARQISELISLRRSTTVLAVPDGTSALKLIDEHDDVVAVVVNAPLPGENAVSFAVELAQRVAAGILLLVKSGQAEAVAARVEPCGVFVVDKPIQKDFFMRALSFAAASAGRLRGGRLETVRLQDKISELQLVDRAKCALIQYLRFTEAQAHRYIEKQAMDCRISKREVALGILQTYEP